MRQMTHEELCQLIRRKQYEAGGLRVLCARHGIHVSTLSNMLGGRNRWTLKVLRLLGLEHVRVMERVSVPPVKLPGTPYRPMWRLGDWPVF